MSFLSFLCVFARGYIFLDGMKHVRSSRCSTKMSFLGPASQISLKNADLPPPEPLSSGTPSSGTPSARPPPAVTGAHSLQSTVIPAWTAIFGVVPVILRSI